MAAALAKKQAAAGLFAAPCEGGWEAGEGGCWQSSVASHNLPARGICAEQTGTVSGASAIRGPLCWAFLNRCTCSSDCCAVARLRLFSRSFLVPSPRPFSFISRRSGPPWKSLRSCITYIGCVCSVAMRRHSVIQRRDVSGNVFSLSQS